MPDGQNWRADYKILFQDGKRGECVEAGLKPYYDGNEKTSWSALKGIYQPKPEKVTHDA